MLLRNEAVNAKTAMGAIIIFVVCLWECQSHQGLLVSHSSGKLDPSFTQILT